jgi:hypothetical protein
MRRYGVGIMFYWHAVEVEQNIFGLTLYKGSTDAA